MFIFADSRIPKEALKMLANYGEVVPFSTTGITYPAISCHPDIFCCKTNDELIVATNVPEKFKEILAKNSIPFIEGESAVGAKYPQTSGYNAVCTTNYVIHNFRNTDPAITDRSDNRDLIHVDQGYTRCNLLPLKDDHFITSDAGISRVLQRYGLNNLFVHPSDILLPGMKHGFFGGACGIHENNVFILGNLNHSKDGNKVRDYLQNLGYEIVELYDGSLFDGGSLLCIVL
jgi:hypothetical protein